MMKQRMAQAIQEYNWACPVAIYAFYCDQRFIIDGAIGNNYCDQRFIIDGAIGNKHQLQVRVP